MNTDLAAIDDAIIERLKAARIAPTVRSLEDEDEVLQPRPDRLPALLTLVNGVRFDQSEGVSRYQEGQVEVTVFVQTRNLRGSGARKGDGGAYELVGAIVDQLLGWSPGACGPLELLQIETLSATKTAAIARVTMVASTEETY